jgi:hypothetical protein
MAIMAAGRMKSKILTITIMIMIPMTSNSKSSAKSIIEGSCESDDSIKSTSLIL